MATSRHDTSGDREALPLDEMCHNLATLYEKLFSARTKWYNIGLKFELTPDTLQAITYQYKTNPEECLRAMLNKRLETVEPLSWKEVCGCLRSPTVERNDVAEKIEEWRIGQRADVNTTSQNLATEVPPLSSLPVTGGLNNSSVKQNNQEVGLGMTSTNVTGENISSTEGTIALIKRNLNNIRMGRIQRPSEASSADLEIKTTFAKVFDSILDSAELIGRRQISKFKAQFFEEVAAQYDNIADTLMKFIEKFTEPRECEQEIRKAKTHILGVFDKATMTHFFDVYLAKLSSDSQYSHSLLVYLHDRRFNQHLEKASPSDINKMVSSLKESVFQSLCNIVKKTRLKVVLKDNNYGSILKKLQAYKWVGTLSQNQPELDRIVNRKPIQITLKDLKGIKLDLTVEEFHLIQGEQQILCDLLREYGVITSKTKDRSIRTFSCANLSLKDIIQLLDNYVCDEVHIVCSECFYIDTSIYSEKWKTRSIAIASPMIYLQCKCTIDLSGNHGRIEDTSIAENGESVTTTYGSGKSGNNGVHGCSGQSGGNLLFQTSKIINPHRLTIKSHGGNGCNGQDGGDGSDGKAKQSEQDDLEIWPKHFCKYFFRRYENIIADIEVIRGKFVKYKDFKEIPTFSKQNLTDFSMYGENHKGVKILFGFTDGTFKRHGFLLSKSKDGISANGGDAGIGGSGGGGGKAGDVHIENMFGQVLCYEGIKVENNDGKDGRSGKTGKPGKRDIARRGSDYVFVSSWTSGQDITYPEHVHEKYSIDILSWERSSKIGALGRRAYFCDPSIAQIVNFSVDSKNVGFFKTEKSPFCLTDYGTECIDGSMEHQSLETVDTTKNRSINKSALKAEYIDRSSQQATICQLATNKLTLLQSLQDLNASLHEDLDKMGEVEAVHVQQCQKTFKKTSCLAPNIELYDITTRPHNLGCKDAVTPSPFSAAQISHKQNGLEDLTPEEHQETIKAVIQLSNISLQEIYVVSVEAIKSLIDEWSSFPTVAPVVNFLAKEFLLPLVSTLTYDSKREIEALVITLDEVKDIINDTQVTNSIGDEKACLFNKHKCLALAEIHRKFVCVKGEVCSLQFQSQAATLFNNTKRISGVKAINNILDEPLDQVVSLTKGLERYELVDRTVFSKHTHRLLGSLTILINEFNSDEDKNYGVVFFPDVLSAVNNELKVFNRTISEPDLQFVISYLQNKLLYLMTKTKLKELLCVTLISDLSDHEAIRHEAILRKCTIILYQERTFRIKEIEYRSACDIRITACMMKWTLIKADSIFRVESPVRITLDNTPIEVPESVLACLVDVHALWNMIKENILKQNKEELGLELAIAKDLWSKLDITYRELLAAALKKACPAQFVPFDIFSFYLPTQWVEQLFLYAVRIHYAHIGKDALDEHIHKLEKSMSGLSYCYDKSFYFVLFNQFLTEKGDCSRLKEICRVLCDMKTVFIDYKLCTLVCREGIAMATACLESRSGEIYDELCVNAIIDSCGFFTTTATLQTIQPYCTENDGKLYSYLINQYSMQCTCSMLASKDLTFWSHKMHDFKVQSELNDLVDSQLDDAIYSEFQMYISMLIHHHGQAQVSKLMLGLKQSRAKLDNQSLRKILTNCTSKEWILQVVIDSLDGKTIKVVLRKLESLNWEDEYKKILVDYEIVRFIKRQLPAGINEQLDDILGKLAEIKRLATNPPICEYTASNIRNWAIKFRKNFPPAVNNKGNLPSQFLEAFGVIRQAIKVFYRDSKSQDGVVPRDTQMIATLLFFQKLSVQGGAVQGTHLMLEIATGEGKTMIISMLAIMKALLGEKVDIVTSSSVLATRDAASQKGLYDLFHISVSHCCHQKLTSRQKAYEADVIYGDIGSFQRDDLETFFYDKSIRTSHHFDNVFIDEVDSMLVDKGETMLYLPHAIPDFSTLEIIYLEIWANINAEGVIGSPQEQESLFQHLKHSIFGGIPSNAFTTIEGISVEVSAAIHHKCCDIGLIDREFHVPSTQDTREIETFIRKLDKVPQGYQQEVLLVFQNYIKPIQRPTIESIPTELHAFVKKHIKTWIQSAVNAKYFQHNKEYIIDTDHTESADRYPKIIIMDNETGVEQESAQWSNGLHQFLQLKHFLCISTETLKAVYMSNITFLKKYFNVMGVTGTLGSSEEHALFSKLYENVYLLKLPPHKTSRLLIEMPKCCTDQAEWESAIYENVSKKLKDQRAVLMICADVEHANYLHQHFSNKNERSKIDLYTSSHQEKLEENGEIEAGKLIIATNLAGRGTDIVLSDTVRDNGGLHVCLTFLPPNVRVEKQAYGRAARQGDRGSCKMIFHNTEGNVSYSVRKRDLHESHRVDDIESDYEHNVKFQEVLFKTFVEKYKIIKTTTHNNRIKLDNCLDCWAFFLDRYTEKIESLPNKPVLVRQHDRQEVENAFKKLLEEVSGEMNIMSSKRCLQMGHSHIKKTKGNDDAVKWDDALEAYKRSIELNPNCPFAKYYEAVAQFKLQAGKGAEHRKALKQNFYRLIPMFQMKVETCLDHIKILQIANCRQGHSINDDTVFFKKQKEHEIEVYVMFIQSMQNVVGHDVNAECFTHLFSENNAISKANCLYEIVREELQLQKQIRISRHNFKARLAYMFEHTDSYYTFEKIIENQVAQMKYNECIQKEDFNELFPDKNYLWKHLCSNHNVETSVSDPQSDSQFGFWNVENVVALEKWSSVCSTSFNWIPNLPSESSDNEHPLVSHLIKNGILNKKRQPIGIKHTFKLPKKYTPFYKQIKDTLKKHCVYHFICSHLSKCVEIDITSFASTDSSVISILTSMSLEAESLVNQHSTETREHVTCQVTVSSNSHHIPSHSMNEKLKSRLLQNNLLATEVSGEQYNCLINALIQHAKRNYFTNEFPEAYKIREAVNQKYPEENGQMLYSDNGSAKLILRSVNDLCSSGSQDKIWKVSEVRALVDGKPIMYEVLNDERYSKGRHVAIWHLGCHFVCIVHKNNFITEDGHVPNAKVTLTSSLLHKLVQLEVIKDYGRGHFKISVSLATFEKKSASNSLLTEEEKCVCRKFLEYKLKINFASLSTGPTNLHHQLYEDLCLYRVIKKVKIKTDISTVRSIFQSPQSVTKYFNSVTSIGRALITRGFRSLLKSSRENAGDILGSRCNLKILFLNKYLKLMKCDELTNENLVKLVMFFDLNDIALQISHDRIIFNGKANTHIASKISSIGFATLEQKKEIEHFVNFINYLFQNKESIISLLIDKRSVLLDLDHSEGTLVKLTDCFSNSVQQPEYVFQQFFDNQCDYVLSISQKQTKWSARSKITALCIIAMGTGHMIAGIAVDLYNNVPKNASDVEDVVFGAIELLDSYCKFSDYHRQKVVRVDTKLLTKFGPGKANRFSAVKTNLGTPQSAPIIDSQSIKFGKNILKIGASMGFDILVETVLNKFSESINTISLNILAHFSTIEENEHLQEQLVQFLHRHSEKPHIELQQVSLQVQQNHTFLNILDNIESKLLSLIVNPRTNQLLSEIKQFKICNDGAELVSNMLHALLQTGPIVNEILKIETIKQKMNAIVNDLETLTTNNMLVLPQLDSDKDEQYRSIAHNEIKAIKKEMCMEVTQRAQKIIKHFRDIAVFLVDEFRFQPSGEHLCNTIAWTHHEKHLKKAFKPASFLYECEGKMATLIESSRCPQTYAYLIENDDVQLKPKFVILALETLFNQQIILQRDGILETNIHHVIENLENPIIVSDSLHGSYTVGQIVFTPKDYGNSCFVAAILESFKQLHVSGNEYDVSKAKAHITSVCVKEKHICNEYIKCGLAYNNSAPAHWI